MNILMAAGGTGGHVIPALALAKEFQRQDPKANIVFVGTSKGFEKRLVPQQGYALELISVEGVKGKGLLQKLKSLALLPKAFKKANQILSRQKPDVVFGIGGYASAPTMILASLRGIPTALLEPNATPGFSNKVLSYFVKDVFLAFAEAGKYFASSKTTVTGNPIRQDILNIEPPDFNTAQKTILIFGGSQGARAINEAVMEMLPLLKSSGTSYRFIHQTGPRDCIRVKAAYEQAGLVADVSEFIDDMHVAYAASHIVIARSGSSVLEIAACGRPSILIPYPFAADNHQLANAASLEKRGAAYLILDQDCQGKTLLAALGQINESVDVLQKMSRAALTLRSDQAAKVIVQKLRARVGAR